MRSLAKSHNYIFTKDIHIRYSENTRTISDIFETDHAHNSKKLYLGAQMELEGVLGLVYMLRELVRSMSMFVELQGTSQRSQEKKSFFCPISTISGKGMGN